MAKCVSLTRKGRDCPIHAAAVDTDGQFRCHIHNSRGVFRQQQAAKPRRPPRYRQNGQLARDQRKAERVAREAAPVIAQRSLTGSGTTAIRLDG
jgi:hypothetical protein